ncbi:MULTISPECIES: ABC transporter ATP-binding protein [unclassified Hyphomicrobium]|uniref:ABC transporter ATP-binding protein n=1 Tax=unclassified Hyphomicrobium TaxID=2619925 RepID=UPI000213F6FC|nr:MULTISPECIES: ABC transporter ATP-binding protein [unclassified Hyphomicrobium]CCB66808.1 Sulfate/thiosulfate import ATP-binding protein CysA [Hyphomicrobium sp. MC1]
MVCALRLERVVKRYGGHAAVDEINLVVEQGEFLTLLGPSGCGKTTTLRLIGGMDRPDSGVIELMGRRVDRLPSYKRDTATVFQSGALFPHLTVAENVAYGLKMRGVPSGDIAPRVTRILDVVRMAAFGGRYPAEMSGGQRQRVALARAMVVEPSILLFDEPMSALDLKLKLELRSEIHRLHEELGFTAVFVTHDQSEAMALSDRIAVMNKGRIEQIGTPIEIFEQPTSEFVYTFVGESCSLALPAAVIGGLDDGTANKRLFIRPTNLKLVNGAGAENVLIGRVTSIEYLGGSYRIHAETEHGALFFDSAKVPEVGPDHMIKIGWRSADATFFPLS